MVDRFSSSPMARKAAIMCSLCSYNSSAGRGTVMACKSAIKNNSCVVG